MQSQLAKPIAITESIFQNWLTGRQALLTSFHQLCQLRPFSSPMDTTLATNLQEFCQLLVDYVSLLHFAVLEKMVDQIEIHKRTNFRVSQHLLALIWKSSIAALHFQDKYQGEQEITALDNDLSALAEEIAQRMELEDKLLAIYYQTLADTTEPTKPVSTMIYAKIA